LALLRNELGDTDYAQYLEARGRTTSISVREVLKSSPAEIGGLMPGDEIVAYNGKRVFDMSELTALTYETEAGTTVPLEVMRDGRSIRIHVEAGPIGISGGGWSSRF
jgi:serine protease Do